MAYEKKYADGDTARTCVRDGFAGNGDVKCKGCFEKKLEIDKLREKITRLQSALRNKERSERDKPFGENTPSSKTLKSNSSEDDRKKQGGAKKAHKGHGRSAKDPKETVGDLVDLPPVETCPSCSIPLQKIDTRNRSIIDIHPLAAFKVLFSFGRFECPCCGDRFKPSVPALPKFQFSNRLLAQAAVLHFLHGLPLKKVSRIMGTDVKAGALHGAFDSLSELCEPAKKLLIQDYRESHIKHADETGWRTDGQSGYAWYFGSENTSVFEFRESRSGAIAREILGNNSLNGFLVVDRYSAYNRIDCEIQYCYAHLLRDVKSLAIEFPDNEEIRKFVDLFGRQLSLAMKLKNRDISDKEFYRQSGKIKEKIKDMADASAYHMGIRRIQNIFREKEHRLYHWASDRRVPAHNNFAEREIRPTTIARKVSFGSQSKKGAMRRSSIMTVLHTAKKRLPTDVKLCTWFEESLNKIANGADPKILRVNPQ